MSQVANVHGIQEIFIEGDSGYRLVQSIANIIIITIAPVKCMDFVVTQIIVELTHIDNIIRYRAFRGKIRSVSQL